jgi:hypothetical protein
MTALPIVPTIHGKAAGRIPASGGPTIAKDFIRG